NNIKCNYVFWDIEGKDRSPKERDFKPNEFEKLYKSLPTLTYYFEDGFTPVDAVIMDKLVQAINEKHSNFDLELDSFHSRGQPHAVFTVKYQEVTDKALKEIEHGYEKVIAKLKGEKGILQDHCNKLIENRQPIHIGDKTMSNTTINTGGGPSAYSEGGTAVIAKYIKDSFNQIEQSNAKDDVKAKLKELSKAVETMVKELPEKKADEVSEGLSTYVKEVVKEEPRKEWYQLTSKGLIEAAKTVNTIGPNVIQTIQEIGTMIGMV
ncbi:MAG: hypothetical protein GY730_08170, partial [bacterium]|nr:hypothetical protein [bacterium]